MAKFTVFVDRAKKYRFNLKASNGEIIASSEAYNTKAAALKGIKSIQKSAATAKIEDLDPDVKKAAVKKPVARKTAVKKPAPKKAADRKPAAKKSAASKPAVKKTAKKEDPKKPLFSILN
jgi:uncharacterized protein YegP (UPF0339 family)